MQQIWDRYRHLSQDEDEYTARHYIFVTQELVLEYRSLYHNSFATWIFAVRANVSHQDIEASTSA